MNTQVPLLDRPAPFMNDIAVSKDGVIQLLKGLNPSKALGPDELHPRVLKELATELGPVFAHLFQQSIDTDEIPKEWSLANICPLFKKSDRSLACNYRPVSLTCVPCKLLKHIVCSNIMAHLRDSVWGWPSDIVRKTIQMSKTLMTRQDILPENIFWDSHCTYCWQSTHFINDC